jgi:caffeoyl-CoA O-methyltransferase
MNLSDPEVEAYCLSKSTTPSGDCEALFAYTKANVQGASMLIGPMGASLLGFLVGVVGAKRVLEVGCFTGYSALSMAERLPEGGELITLDINLETSKVAEVYWAKSSHGKKIRLVLGPALESLKTVKGPFDFILIDADKENYLAYLRCALDLVSARGMIALDNCLWSGKVFDSKTQDPETRALREVAGYIKSRSDLVSVLLPIRDGIMLVQKKGGQG